MTNRPVNANVNHASARARLGKPLVALLIASLLVPLLIFTVVAWQGYHAAFRAAELRGQQIANLLEEHAHSTFKTIELALRHADERLKDADWNTIRTSRELWTELKAFQGLAPPVGSIFVITPDGKNALTTRAFPSPPLDFSERDYFRAQRERDAGVYVGKGYVGRISSEPIFNLSIRRRSADGTFNGVIGSSAYTEYFETFYANGGAAHDHFAIELVRSDGEVLVGFPRIPDRHDLDPRSFATAASGQGTFSMRSPDTGIKRLYTFRKVKDYPVYVVYGIDRSTIIAAWLRDLALWGLITVASLATLLFAWWLVMRRTADVEAQVTERTAALARMVREKDVLLREVHHRVKNNLQTMASMVRIVSRTGTQESQPAFQDIARRIVTVGRAYDHIHKTDRLAELELSAYLRGICDQVFAGSGRQDVKLTTRLDPLMVDIDTALPIGLITSELLTNAFKHAFDGDRGGTILVRLKVLEDHATLTIRDSGGGITQGADSAASGLRIAETLAAQIDGRLRGKNRPQGGAQFRLTFPLRERKAVQLRRAGA